jgi:hypothetical protein
LGSFSSYCLARRYALRQSLGADQKKRPDSPQPGKEKIDVMPLKNFPASPNKIEKR